MRPVVDPTHSRLGKANYLNNSCASRRMGCLGIIKIIRFVVKGGKANYLNNSCASRRMGCLGIIKIIRFVVKGDPLVGPHCMPHAF